MEPSSPHSTRSTRPQDSQGGSTLVPDPPPNVEPKISSHSRRQSTRRCIEFTHVVRNEGSHIESRPISEYSENTKCHTSPFILQRQSRNIECRSTNRPFSESPERTECAALPRSDHQQPKRQPRRVSVEFFDSPGVLHLARTLTSSSGSATLVGEEYTEVDRETFGEPLEAKLALRNFLYQWENSGHEAKRLGMVYENLRVIGAGRSWEFQPTLASTFNPFNIIEHIRSFFRPPLHDIICNFDGVVSPGEMLLVLGRPRAGCSTFLRVLANLRHNFHSVEGNVHYDTFTPAQIAKHCRGDVQYFYEGEHHWPVLTVDQTIHFAAKTRALEPVMCGMTRGQYTRFLTDIYITMFGLGHLKDSCIGGFGIPGISVAEQLRVSVCEMLANRCRIACWDNSTKKLDGSASLEFVRSLRMATDLAGISTVASLYRVGEQTYELFDKVCLIYEGKLAYFGRADQARQYFIDMGYVPTDSRQTTADFLVSVTDTRMRNFYLDRITHHVPRSATEFEAHYRTSEARMTTLKEISSYKRSKANIAKEVKYPKGFARWLPHSHTVSIPMQAKLVFIRRIQLTKSVLIYRVITSIGSIVEGCILGANFEQLPNTTSSYFSRSGVIFLSLMVPTLVVIEEVSNIFRYRMIVLRQTSAAMHHYGMEAIAWTLFDAFFTFLDVMMFAIPVYFIADLQQTTQQFLIYFLFLFTMVICLRNGVRAVAVCCDSITVARENARNAVLLLSLYIGYEVQPPHMLGALRWISYINPYRYAFAAMVTSQFRHLASVCKHLIPSGPGYEDVSPDNQVCGIPGSIAGQQTAEGQAYSSIIFGYSIRSIWRNFGILCAFSAVFILIFLFAAEFRTALPERASPLLFSRTSKALGGRKRILGFHDIEELKEPCRSLGIDAAEEITDQFDAPTYREELSNYYHPTIRSFSWRHITFVLHPELPELRCRFSNGVSGYVAPGHLTAFLGASGAGASTLLKILAGRMDLGAITGDVYLNGHPLTSDFVSQVGYCQEKDVHVPTETVREALSFSARLRQPNSISIKDKDAYANRCLQTCGLETIADATLGSLYEEQLKRVSIAIELAAKPLIILCVDKPMLGLDSQGARATALFLRNLANRGLTILCTVDQPSAEVLQHFDEVLVLREDGESVYFGDVGRNAVTLTNYFETNGSRKCSSDENPAEFVLDIIRYKPLTGSEDDWNKIWLKSREFERLQSRIEMSYAAESRTSPPAAPIPHSQFAVNWIEQVIHLMQRQIRYSWRNPFYLIMKFYFNAIAGVAIGLTFSRKSNSIRGTRDKVFAVFAASFLSFPLGSQIIPPYIKMRAVYEGREHQSRTYHWTALTTSCLLSDLPWNFLASSIFFFTWYWLTGFPTSRWGLVYFQFGFLFPLYYTTLSLAVAAICPSVTSSELLFAAIYTIVLAFDDVVQPFYDYGWMIWLYYITPTTYLIDSCVAQVAANQPIRCGDDEFVKLNPPSGSTCGLYLAGFMERVGGYVTNPRATSECYVCPYSLTDHFLYRNYHIWFGMRWKYSMIFVGFIVFNICAFYLFAYFRMRYITRRHFSKQRILGIFKKLKRMPHL